nr:BRASSINOSTEROID INSENSITIVE 1-associated receptor kinase 1-like isoform X2 [Physcomitrium patens]|eukprot:XP_024365351.1 BRASSINOSTEROID INSENSITIVE 1-associated receptor kinase 1-like isoform X2 [Physcomitrella patens]
MSGDIPKEIGSLTNLREMTLWLNSWKSQIPTEFGNLVNLEYLNIRDSGLWGGLPSEMGALTRLRRLHVYNNLLTGGIPDTWQSMKMLKELRLSKNYLSGDVPPWIWTFQNLSNIQLQDNRFTGSYPANLSASVKTLNLQCNFLTGSTLPVRPATFLGDSWDVDDNCFDPKVKRVENKCLTSTLCDAYASLITNNACPPCPVNQESYNSSLCTCRPTDPKKNSYTGAIVGGVLGAFGALFIVAIIYGILWKRKKDKVKQADASFDPALLADANDPNWQAPSGVQRFKLAELSNATDGFNKTHEIGVGGFGKVFVGTFKDGRTMAIKRASGSVTSNQGLAEFRNEVMLLSRLHHKNLVRLEGFCDESGLQILVYEYMSQGNLHAHLFKPNGSGKSLNWYSRLEIAVGVANGLNYLHTFADPPVIHRDVKPSNILLDDNLIAKVADFGISKATDEFATHVSTRPAGTAGYLDPQYFLRQQLTTASDVYGFGIVLLELVTGQRAIDHSRVDEFNLVEWARPKFKSGGIEAIVDSKLDDSYPKDIYTDMAEIALSCALFNKDDRPAMKDVLSILEPHFHSCKAPISHDYSSGWESMDLTSAPSHTDTGFTGTSDSFTNASSSNSYILENTRSKMATSQLLR